MKIKKKIGVLIIKTKKKRKSIKLKITKNYYENNDRVVQKQTQKTIFYHVDFYKKKKINKI